jgi:hypothetical protein
VIYRKEVFKLLNYSYLYPDNEAFKSQVMPDFEDIEGKSYASLCNENNPKFEKYCKLEQAIPSLEKFFKVSFLIFLSYIFLLC